MWVLSTPGRRGARRESEAQPGLHPSGPGRRSARRELESRRPGLTCRCLPGRVSRGLRTGTGMARPGRGACADGRGRRQAGERGENGRWPAARLPLGRSWASGAGGRRGAAGAEGWGRRSWVGGWRSGPGAGRGVLRRGGEHAGGTGPVTQVRRCCLTRRRHRAGRGLRALPPREREQPGDPGGRTLRAGGRPAGRCGGPDRA